MRKKILQFIHEQPKDPDGVSESMIFVLGGHQVETLQDLGNNELIAQLIDLETHGYIDVITRQETKFPNTPSRVERYYRLTLKGLNELKPLLPRVAYNIWQWILEDGYKILSILSLVISIISFFFSFNK